MYIVTNKKAGTLYTGVTSDLPKRIHEHKTSGNGFSGRYNCNLLVWYEQHTEMYNAIAREKQIKAGSRNKKLVLVEKMNPGWQDLYNSIL